MKKIDMFLEEPFSIKENIRKRFRNYPQLEQKEMIKAINDLQILINHDLRKELMNHGLTPIDVASCLSKKNALRHFLSWLSDGLTWHDAWEQFLECLSARKTH